MNNTLQCISKKTSISSSSDDKTYRNVTKTGKDNVDLRCKYDATNTYSRTERGSRAQGTHPEAEGEQQRKLCKRRNRYRIRKPYTYVAGIVIVKC